MTGFNGRHFIMASIYEKRLRSGRIIWELSHGREPNRIRMKAGDTKAEAEATLALFNRQLAHQGAAPAEITLRKSMEAYGE
jgi:hypothetical protein